MAAPTKKTRRYPVSSFGPEIMAALIKGSNEKVILKFRKDGTRSAMTQAIYLQHRIHTLRAMMRTEGHDSSELVSRARTSRVWGEKVDHTHKDDVKGEQYVELHIYPNDSQFESVFKEAGVDVPEVKVDLAPDQEAALEELTSDPAFADPYKDFKPG